MGYEPLWISHCSSEDDLDIQENLVHHVYVQNKHFQSYNVMYIVFMWYSLFLNMHSFSEVFVHSVAMWKTVLK